MREFMPEKFDFDIVIEFPDKPTALPVYSVPTKIMLAETGEQITTIGAVTIHMARIQGNLVWAEVEMLADEQGKPVFTGNPYLDRNSTIITEVFNVRISEILSGASYREGYAHSKGAVHV
jgi:hypothetical protein